MILILHVYAQVMTIHIPQLFYIDTVYGLSESNIRDVQWISLQLQIWYCIIYKLRAPIENVVYNFVLFIVYYTVESSYMHVQIAIQSRSLAADIISWHFHGMQATSTIYTEQRRRVL